MRRSKVPLPWTRFYVLKSFSLCRFLDFFLFLLSFLKGRYYLLAQSYNATELSGLESISCRAPWDSSVGLCNGHHSHLLLRDTNKNAPPCNVISYCCHYHSSPPSHVSHFRWSHQSCYQPCGVTHRSYFLFTCRHLYIGSMCWGRTRGTGITVCGEHQNWANIFSWWVHPHYCCAKCKWATCDRTRDEPGPMAGDYLHLCISFCFHMDCFWQTSSQALGSSGGLLYHWCCGGPYRIYLNYRNFHQGLCWGWDEPCKMFGSGFN